MRICDREKIHKTQTTLRTVNCDIVLKHRDLFVEYLKAQHTLEDARPLEGPGFIGVDASVSMNDDSMIKVGATVIVMFPLAAHGGPLWEPMCYAQIGGLSVATFVTLLLVPVIYAIFVLDLKLVKWESHDAKDEQQAPSEFVRSGDATIRTATERADG